MIELISIQFTIKTVLLIPLLVSTNTDIQEREIRHKIKVQRSGVGHISI